VHGEPCAASPELDQALGRGDLHGLAGPGPRHAIPAALPGHEAVAAHPTLLAQEGLDALGRRQRQQVRRFAEEAIERALAGGAVHADVGHAVHPGVRLVVEIHAVLEFHRRPEVVLHVLDAALDAPFRLRAVRAAQPRLEAEPQGEVQKRRVPVRHAGGVSPQDHHFRIVVEAGARQAAEALEGVQMAADEARDVGAPDELDIEQP